MFDVLYDAHCHLSPSMKKDFIPGLCSRLNVEYGDLTEHFNLMSTYQCDIEYVHEIASKCNCVIPCFGVHPWYSHLYTSHDYSSFTNPEKVKQEHYSEVLTGTVPPGLLEVLPEPVYLPNQLERIRMHIASHPQFMVGEIGLDKTFRVPWNGYLGSDVEIDCSQRSNFTSCYVKMSHQQCIFGEFLQLAMEYGVPVSVHCVKAHGVLYDQLKNTSMDLKVCLHSYSGSPEQARQWVSNFDEVYFSLSNIINWEGTRDGGKQRERLRRIVNVIPPSSILVESDMSLDRYYAETPYADHQCDLRLISEAVTAMTRTDLLANWRTFLSSSRTTNLSCSY